MSSETNEMWTRFQASTGWLAVMVLIVWASSQGIQPFIDPLLLYWTGFVVAMFYCVMHSLSERRSRLNLIGFAITGIISTIMMGVCVGQASYALMVIKEPCKKLRADFVAHPDSAKSDAYEALHCPAYQY